MCVPSNVLYMERALLAAKQQIKCEKLTVKNEFEKLIEKIDLRHDEDIEVEKNPESNHVEKKITFFYTDKGEFYNLKPIEKEAVKRGDDVRFTSDITEKAEIGIYCQHVCFPQNTKFSVVLLHDMAQGHNR